MHFKFDITLTDRDYLDYNIFWTLKSPYGKKQLFTFRITIAVIMLVIALLSLYGGGFSPKAWLGIIPYAVLLLLLELLLDRFFVWSIKGQLASLKKKGKMGYSPLSKMEFYEQSFVEMTPQNKTEQIYSAIERVSIIRDKIVYLHVNNVMSFLIPFSCFASREQCDAFIAFIKTKCNNVDTY